MYVTVVSFRARPGEEDAVVALHEEWDRTLRPRAIGFVSGELLTGLQAPSAFIRITRFSDAAAARLNDRDPEQMAWARRMASLTSGETESHSFDAAWSSSESIEAPVGPDSPGRLR